MGATVKVIALSTRFAQHSALNAASGGLVLVPEFGLMGAAVSRAIIRMVLIGIGMWFVMVRLEFPFPTKSVVYIYLCSVCSSAVAWSIVAVLDAPVSIPAAIVAAGVVYLLCLRLLRAVDPNDLRTLSTVVCSFPRPLPVLGGRVLWFLGHPLKQSGP